MSADRPSRSALSARERIKTNPVISRATRQQSGRPRRRRRTARADVGVRPVRHGLRRARQPRRLHFGETGVRARVPENPPHCAEHVRITVCSVSLSNVEKKGATLQLTLFDPDRKVVCCDENKAVAAVHVSGRDVLSNAQVNVASLLITSAAGALLGPYFFGD